MVAVPAVPVVIAEVIGVLDKPFCGSAAPFNIYVVVLALVVQIPDVVVRSAFGVLGVYIATVLRTIGNYVCISDGVCACGDTTGPVYSHQVGWVGQYVRDALMVWGFVTPRWLVQIHNPDKLWRQVGPRLKQIVLDDRPSGWPGQ